MTSPAHPKPRALSEDVWSALRVHTPARIALGRAGSSLPTRELLAFGLAHAQARDAVHTPLDVKGLQAQLQEHYPTVIAVRSRARDRAAYLARPDWGRRVHPDDLPALHTHRGDYELLFVLSDGLSSTALAQHAVELLAACRSRLGGLRWAPIVIATQARVALGDEVASTLGAELVVHLIGERPGLSAADSLGAYLSWQPTVGTTDEARNCISNIRPAGLAPAAAALQIEQLVHRLRLHRCAGIALNHCENMALPVAAEHGQAHAAAVAGRTASGLP